MSKQTDRKRNQRPSAGAPKRTAVARSSRSAVDRQAASGSGNQATRDGQAHRSYAAVFFRWLFTIFSGRWVLTIFLIAIFLGLLLLITGNDFDRFFLLTGIGLVVAALLGWVISLLRNRRPHGSSHEGAPPPEQN